MYMSFRMTLDHENPLCKNKTNSWISLYELLCIKYLDFIAESEIYWTIYSNYWWQDYNVSCWRSTTFHAVKNNDKCVHALFENKAYYNKLNLPLYYAIRKLEVLTLCGIYREQRGSRKWYRNSLKFVFVANVPDNCEACLETRSHGSILNDTWLWKSTIRK